MKTNKVDLFKVLMMAEESESLIAVEDGFDKSIYHEAILGITDDARIVYSKDAMIDILSKRLVISYYDAFEYLEKNCFNITLGDKTPLFINQ